MPPKTQGKKRPYSSGVMVVDKSLTKDSFPGQVGIGGVGHLDSYDEGWDGEDFFLAVSSPKERRRMQV